MMMRMYTRVAVIVVLCTLALGITLVNGGGMSGGGGGGKEKSLICYYNAQTLIRPTGGKLIANKIDPFLCTHIIYCYADISEENTLAFPYGLESLASLRAMKGQNSKLKILIAVGGPDVVQYGEMVKSREFRSIFIKNVTNFLAKQQIDGVSLDWEWPGDQGPEDRDNFTRLLSEMKESLKPGNYLMMSAVSPNRTIIDSGYNTEELSRNLDFVTIKAYGFRRATGKTAPHSALYGSQVFDWFKEDHVRNVNWTVNYWLKQKGFDAANGGSKLILGVALYGAAYRLAEANLNKFNSPTVLDNDGGPFTQFVGLLAYNEILHLNKTRNNKWILVRDSEYKVPYAIYGNRWVTYDDLESLRAKASYVMAKKLGGMSVMSLDFDDFNGTHHAETFALTRKLRESLGLIPKTRTPSPSPSSTTTTTTTTTKRPRSTTRKPEAPKTTTSTTTTTTTETATTEVMATDPPPDTTTSTTRRPRPRTSTTAEPKPPSDGVPPTCGDGGMWYFPGPSCRQYYDCSSGTPALKTCPDEMIWKQSELWCDLQINVPECQL